MELTIKQEQGLGIAINRYRNNEKCTVIGGYAGTGKSTLVKFIISALAQDGIDPDKDVCYCAFTGKATQVLQKKGNLNVSTLHKLLYDSIPKESGGYIRKPKPIGDIDYKIIVVDEVSMAPKTLMELLFKHPAYVICLGDPFQLPPIDKNEDNHLLDKPHIFLDEVMRQAQESGIIRLSMIIREGKSFDDNISTSDLIVRPQRELTTGMLTWADQVIVGTNATRFNINNQMRQIAGFGPNPQEGDKVICLRNYWDIFDNADNALVNGTIGYLKNAFETFNQIPFWASQNIRQIPIIGGNIETESGTTIENIQMDKQIFLTGNNTLDWKTSYRLGKSDKTRHLLPQEFTYGYAITCHKSQGSSWPKVCVVEEAFPYEKIEHARWLYTAVTRAESKLVLLR